MGQTSNGGGEDLGAIQSESNFRLPADRSAICGFKTRATSGGLRVFDGKEAVETEPASLWGFGSPGHVSRLGYRDLDGGVGFYASLE